MRRGRRGRDPAERAARRAHARQPVRRDRRLPPAAARRARGDGPRRPPRATSSSGARSRRAAARSSPAARRGSGSRSRASSSREGAARRDLRAQRGRGPCRRRGAAQRRHARARAARRTSPIPPQVRDFVARSAEALGGVDCLVNNAGRAHPGGFETLSDEDWLADLDVKLFSLDPLLPRGAAAPARARAAAGSSTSAPSTAATPTRRSSRPRSTAPPALAFTKTLALEVATRQRSSSTASTSASSSRRSGTTSTAGARPSSRGTSSSRQLAAQEVPLGRFGTPEEVSGVVAFLLGDAGELHHRRVDRRRRRHGQVRLKPRRVKVCGRALRNPERSR